jgi:electron transfer flavoprotein beta subunit
VILMGKQAIDDDCNQTPQMLAALLGWPQATFASKIELENGTATVAREVDAGLEYLSVDLPAVISTDLRLNVPRYAKLPDIMKARRLPIETLTIGDLGVELGPEPKVLKVEPPPRRQAGRKVATVAELLAALRERGALQ